MGNVQFLFLFNGLWQHRKENKKSPQKGNNSTLDLYPLEKKKGDLCKEGRQLLSFVVGAIVAALKVNIQVEEIVLQEILPTTLMFVWKVPSQNEDWYKCVILTVGVVRNQKGNFLYVTLVYNFESSDHWEGIENEN